MENTMTEQTGDGRNRKRTARKWICWIAGVVAALLIILLIAGALTEWFGIYGPLTRVVLAAKNTMDERNMTADISLTIPDTAVVSGVLRCRWDVENREIAADLTLHINDTTIVGGIVDGYVVWRGTAGKVRAVDVQDELNELFDAMDSEKELDESLRSFLKTVFDGAGITKQVDMEAAVACLKRAFFRWNRTEWLQENAGYSLKKEGEVSLYRFAPKMGKALIAMLRDFETAFPERDDYKNAIDFLKSRRAKLNDAYCLDVTLGVSSGKLTKLEVAAAWEKLQFTAQIDLKKIGKTKVDTDMLREMLQSSKK